VTFGRRPLVVLLTLLLCACARSAADRSDIRRITIVDFSDWHGQLEPVPVTVGGVTRLVGGAAVLKAYFDRERGANPEGTLVVTAGDAFGATPPVASFMCRPWRLRTSWASTSTRWATTTSTTGCRAWRS
jgi:2',3'-cyclic-nucleotide 2'-phosphodiesterase (5'-nucleotidase family)